MEEEEGGSRIPDIKSGMKMEMAGNAFDKVVSDLADRRFIGRIARCMQKVQQGDPHAGCTPVEVVPILFLAGIGYLREADP
jgi:hypothetical protein